MKQLSKGDGLSLALVGSQPPELSKCTNYSSIHKYFRLEHLPREGIDCYWIDGKESLDELPEVDALLNINPGARKEMLTDFEAFRAKGTPVIFQTKRIDPEFWDDHDGFGLSLIPTDLDEPAANDWGNSWTRVSKNAIYLYPYAPRPHVTPQVERGTIVIDNHRDKRYSDVNDTRHYHTAFRDLQDEFDLKVYQETAQRDDVPDFIEPIATGNHIKTYDDGGPPRAVMPWIEYKEYINKCMLFCAGIPGSYGADKFNAIASEGQVLIRDSYEKRACVSEFDFHTFGNPSQIKQCVRDAFDRYDRQKARIEAQADSIWTVERFADEIIDCLETIL